MAAIKTSPMASTDLSPVRYHVTNPEGNHVQMVQRGSNLVLLLQGTGSPGVVLTQQNVSDLATAFSGFGSTGTLS